METNDITGEVVRAAMRAHTVLGPGLLETIYRRALAHELRKRGLKVIEEKPIPVTYDGVVMGTGLRLDLLVEDSVIVETKSIRRFTDVDESQILSHLQLTKCRAGLLINFNVRHLRDGIRRYVR